MKVLFVCAFLLLCSLGNAQELEVMSFNIRLNTPADSLNAWPHRKDKVAAQILFHETDIVGVQEAQHNQMMDLHQRLPGFGFTGVARDDGKEKGEYSAIFYDSTRVQLIQSQTFWLSETPAVPGSKSWDAAITRIVTWGLFRLRENDKLFYVFNTHFDHIGKEARKQSAILLLKKIAEITGSHPVIITGDFNARPSEDPIRILKQGINRDHLTDTKEISAEPHYGPDGTFNGWTSRELDQEPIDFIFIRNKVKVLKHATLSETWQGRFSSDHFPVWTRLLL